MTKKEFTELTGEDPEDMFGPDWENILEDLAYNSDRPHEFANDWQNGDWPCGKRRVEE